MNPVTAILTGAFFEALAKLPGPAKVAAAILAALWAFQGALPMLPIDETVKVVVSAAILVPAMVGLGAYVGPEVIFALARVVNDAGDEPD